jgi:hypothetical protein
MYHPPDIFRHETFQDNGIDEYIELQNITDETVPVVRFGASHKYMASPRRGGF